MHGRPPGQGTQEKSKDFKGAMTRLFKNLNNWRYLIFIALEGFLIQLLPNLCL